jgi:hypothetical protein
LLIGCASAAYVPRIEIENPTEYDLSVEVRGKEGGPSLPLGIAKRGRESVMEQVIDQGEDWILTFSYLGDEVGAATFKRSVLERAQWRVVIPEEIGHRLREERVPPSY